jgi:hypothetical protein
MSTITRNSTQMKCEKAWTRFIPTKYSRQKGGSQSKVCHGLITGKGMRNPAV